MIKRPAQAATRAAFTLMEMLVVVAILVVLAGAAVPIYMSYLDNARIDRMKLDFKTLEMALEAYEAKHGFLPQDWTALTQPDPNEPGTRAALDAETVQKNPWNMGGYTFNPGERHPLTAKPRIMTTTPSGQKSNW